MAKPIEIPSATIQRLSLYLRQLLLSQQQGLRTVSSRHLGDAVGISDAQVRKDLAYFGPFGHPGIGYPVGDLIERIRRILGTDRNWRVVIIGAGNLGRALAAYGGFSGQGFDIVAVCDIDLAKVGTPVSPVSKLQIQHLDELSSLVQTLDIRLAILTVPASVAQIVADQAFQAGIQGILNFAPATLNYSTGHSVCSVDLALEMQQLTYRVLSNSNQPNTAIS
ncbi:MAG: Redox-sensing transcriptional repressor Rex [Phycisphaerae bacterium]|nr:Redox-sensing transcriptional repressor Rex [Phycisphaerae bacterium]